MNETLEWVILNDGYNPTRKEVLELSQKLLDMRVKDKTCLVCGKDTNCIFNISMKAVFVCEQCADMITIQNVIDRCSKKSDVNVLKDVAGGEE